MKGAPLKLKSHDCNSQALLLVSLLILFSFNSAHAATKKNGKSEKKSTVCELILRGTNTTEPTFKKAIKALTTDIAEVSAETKPIALAKLTSPIALSGNVVLSPLNDIYVYGVKNNDFKLGGTSVAISGWTTHGRRIAWVEPEELEFYNDSAFKRHGTEFSRVKGHSTLVAASVLLRRESPKLNALENKTESLAAAEVPIPSTKVESPTKELLAINTVIRKTEGLKPEHAVAAAVLSSNSFFRDPVTGSSVSGIKTKSKRIALVYGRANDSLINPDYVVSFFDDDGKPRLVRTADWNFRFLKESDYPKGVALSELQEKYEEIAAKQRENERKRLIAERERELKQTAELQANFISALKHENANSGYLREMLNYRWVQAICDGTSKTLTLLTGAANNADANEAVELARSAAKNGYIVFFDADVPTAPLIAEAVGDRGVGITSEVTAGSETMLHNSQILSIPNPYLRMKAFAYSNNRIMTADSVTGFGLLLQKDIDGTINNSDFPILGGLRKWTDNIDGYSFGIRDNYNFLSIQKFKTNNEAIESLRGKKSKYSKYSDYEKYSDTPGIVFAETEPVRLNDGQFIAKLDRRQFSQISNYQREMTEAVEALRQKTPGGAVVFGSSTRESKYDSMVYSISKTIAQSGLAIATGGADGFMRIANDAAINSGGISIGIPLESGSLWREKSAAKDVHNLTLSTTDYRTRIPLLLYMNNVVVVMPGGKGTLQELATAFVNFASGLNKSQSIIFVANDFYGSLANYLKESKLPASVLSRIYLVNSADDIRNALSDINTKYLDNGAKSVKTERLRE